MFIFCRSVPVTQGFGWVGPQLHCCKSSLFLHSHCFVGMWMISCTRTSVRKLIIQNGKMCVKQKQKKHVLIKCEFFFFARQIFQTHILTVFFFWDGQRMLTFFGIMFEQTNQSEQFGGFLRTFVVFVFLTLDTFCITDTCKHMGQHCYLMAT